MTNPSKPNATAVGIVIDPYDRTISTRSFPLSDSLEALQAVVGGLIEPMRLRKHDVLYVNEEALLRIGSPDFPYAGFRFDGRTFFGRGIIIAERVNTLPRPEITVDEVTRRTTWLNASEARAAHAAIVVEHSAPPRTIAPHDLMDAVDATDPNDPNAVANLLRALLPPACLRERDWEAAGNRWAPQANFMISDRNSLLAAFVTLARFGQHALTFHAGCYFPRTLTLEVQFTPEAGNKAVTFYNRLPNRMANWRRHLPGREAA